MNREEKLLCDLIDYFQHLDASDKFYCSSLILRELLKREESVKI